MKLTIKRSEWLQGEGAERSFLLRPSDGKMCCLGFLACQLGATKEQIQGKKTPDEYKELSWPTTFFTEDRSRNSNSCVVLFTTNDDQHFSLEKRELLLTEAFAKHGIEVEFVD